MYMWKSEFQEANIEFIATAENSRRKGVGERILQGAIQYIFSFQGMRGSTMFEYE